MVFRRNRPYAIAINSHGKPWLSEMQRAYLADENNEMTGKVKQVADQYEKNFGVKYDGDWFLLKLQEELGEMTQKYLIMTNRTRRKPELEVEAKAALAEEIADTFSYVLLLRSTSVSTSSGR